MTKIEIYLNIFIKHFHNNWLVLLLALAGLFLLIYKVEKHNVRIMIMFGIVVALIIGYNPCIFILMERVGEASSYYRLLWGWPIVILAGYCVFLIQEKAKRLEWGLMLGWICIISILFIKNNTLVLPDSIENINKNIVEIAEAIELDKEYEEVRFVGDRTCTYGMREYDANILLPFGEVVVTNVKYDITLFEMISSGQEITNVAQFEDLLYIYKVDYFAVKKEYISINETIQQLGKEIIYTNDEYILYKNENYKHDENSVSIKDESIEEKARSVWGNISSLVIVGVLFIIKVQMKKVRN